MKYFGLKLLLICLLLPVFQNHAEDAVKLLKPTSEVSLSPSYGDTLVQQCRVNPETFNPLFVNSAADSEILGLIFESLTQVNADLTLSPCLADSWEVSRDNKRITYYLKKNVKWHDGVNFTAEDVRFTFEKIMDPVVGSNLQCFFVDASTVEIINTYEVSILMKKPTPDLPVITSTGIIPKHIFERENLATSEYSKHPIGTGPFKFFEYKQGEQVVLAANQDYFGERPYLNRVIFKIIPDTSASLLSLLRGELDLMLLNPDYYTKQANSKEFHDKFNIYTCPSYVSGAVAFNLDDPILKDRNIRRALTIAINRQSIIDNVYYGFGKTVATDVLPTCWAFDSSVPQYPYDPEQAKKILSDAGWKDMDQDGILERNGEKFTLEFSTSKGDKLLADIIRDSWKAIGINVKSQLLDWGKFVEQLTHHKFQATIMCWQQSSALYDPFGLWHSSQIPDEKNGYSGANVISYRNPEIDRLCELSRSTFDREKLKEIYFKMQAIIHEDQPYVFLYTTDFIYAVSKRFHGIKPANAGIFYNFPYWYVPEGLQKYK
ncbi:MAG: peptide-binding protein [Candidatus Wallbacteria bacterium]|nr:peptide-binding protein [Candidatus Wallbacteria bacterium]